MRRRNLHPGLDPLERRDTPSTLLPADDIRYPVGPPGHEVSVPLLPAPTPPPAGSFPTPDPGLV